MAKEYKQLYLDFDQYIRQGELPQRERADAWRTAIGLQAVDGLTTSEYLQQTALRNIEGDITMDQARELIHSYYAAKDSRVPGEEDMQEADKASANIAKILSTQTLDFSSKGYVAIHRRIFEGVFGHAGKIRDYDISKREWVLEGDSVAYLNWEDLSRALDYDIAQERAFSYKDLSQDQTISHLAAFISGIWQIHAFGEGNTRATAVFALLYLRSLGFKADNELFARHSWYFRNALVRANYKSAVKGIDYAPVYLERFLRNLLLGEQWDLRNRYLHIHPSPEWRVQPRLSAPEQVPEQVPEQAETGIDTDNEHVTELVNIIGDGAFSISELMEKMQLKHRPNFMDYHLRPAMNEGFVRMRYPDSPRHPRQKYLLTPKGLLLLKEIMTKGLS